jgi:hypothetical protein
MRFELSGDTVVSDGGGSHSYSSHDNVQAFNFDGTPTVIGPGSFSLRRIDDFTFNILSKIKTATADFSEVSHFFFHQTARR